MDFWLFYSIHSSGPTVAVVAMPRYIQFTLYYSLDDSWASVFIHADHCPFRLDSTDSCTHLLQRSLWRLVPHRDSKIHSCGDAGNNRTFVFVASPDCQAKCFVVVMLALDVLETRLSLVMSSPSSGGSICCIIAWRSKKALFVIWVVRLPDSHHNQNVAFGLHLFVLWDSITHSFSPGGNFSSVRSNVVRGDNTAHSGESSIHFVLLHLWIPTACSSYHGRRRLLRALVLLPVDSNSVVVLHRWMLESHTKTL
jgi:hypothetical protein